MRAPTAAARRRRAADDEALARGRAVALFLQSANPGWFVLYGPASRRLWAYAAWRGAPALVLSSTDARRLMSEMRRSEHEHGAAAVPSFAVAVQRQPMPGTATVSTPAAHPAASIPWRD